MNRFKSWLMSAWVLLLFLLPSSAIHEGPSSGTTMFSDLFKWFDAFDPTVLPSKIGKLQLGH